MKYDIIIYSWELSICSLILGTIKYVKILHTEPDLGRFKIQLKREYTCKKLNNDMT